MSTAQRLSNRIEAGVRHGEVHSMGVIPTVTQRLGRADTIRGMLRLMAREGIRLSHGDVKHARDIVRSIERAAARL